MATEYGGVTWALPPPQKRRRGRPRRGEVWDDPEAEHVIRIAALVAQEIAAEYEAARWIAATLPRLTEPASIRKRLVRKRRAYFPAGLAPDDPLNILVVPGVKLSVAPDPLAAIAIYDFADFAELCRRSACPVP
jgi:hypothetical protein